MNPEMLIENQTLRYSLSGIKKCGQQRQLQVRLISPPVPKRTGIQSLVWRVFIYMDLQWIDAILHAGKKNDPSLPNACSSLMLKKITDACLTEESIISSGTGDLEQTQRYLFDI